MRPFFKTFNETFNNKCLERVSDYNLFKKRDSTGIPYFSWGFLGVFLETGETPLEKTPKYGDRPTRILAFSLTQY